MPTEPPKVDWEQVKRCFATLQREARPFLSRALLMGGAACLFYRTTLRRAMDPDFPAPELPPELEAKWLSKDLDFTGIFSGDAMALMPQLMRREPDGRAFLVVEGVRLGFAQAGLTIDPDEARERCRVARFTAEDGTTVEFFVADPVTLYRGKLALTQHRNAPADSLHLALLAEYLRYETCLSAEQLAGASSLADAKKALSFLGLVRDRASEVLNDARVARRIQACLRRHSAMINPPDAQFLGALLRESEGET